MELWPIYRLVCEGKVSLGDIDKLSIDDIDLANRSLDAWQAAEARAHKKAQNKK